MIWRSGQMVMILHGMWCDENSAPGHSGTPRKFFFLWGESSVTRRGPSQNENGSPRKSRKAQELGDNIYPYQPTREELLKTQVDVFHQSNRGVTKDGEEERDASKLHSLLLLIPTAGGKPQASSPLISEDDLEVADSNGAAEHLSLVPWVVDGLRLEPEEAIPSLIVMKERVERALQDEGRKSKEERCDAATHYLLG